MIQHLYPSVVVLNVCSCNSSITWEFLDMLILGLHPKPTESETPSLPGGSDAAKV